eukprot:5424014-Alexandrium_andersonii.AAC.1
MPAMPDHSSARRFPGLPASCPVGVNQSRQILGARLSPELLSQSRVPGQSPCQSLQSPHSSPGRLRHLPAEFLHRI